MISAMMYNVKSAFSKINKTFFAHDDEWLLSEYWLLSLSCSLPQQNKTPSPVVNIANLLWFGCQATEPKFQNRNSSAEKKCYFCCGCCTSLANLKENVLIDYLIDSFIHSVNALCWSGMWWIRGLSWWKIWMSSS